MAFINNFTYLLIILIVGFQFQTAFGADNQANKLLENVKCASRGERKVAVTIQTNLKNDISQLLREFLIDIKAENSKQQQICSTLSQEIGTIKEKQAAQDEELKKLRNELTNLFSKFKLEIVESIGETFKLKFEKALETTTTTAILSTTPKTKQSKKKFDEHFNCLADCNGENFHASCEEAFKSQTNVSTANDAYLLHIPDSKLKPFYAICRQFDGQTWTIIQNRFNGAVNFLRNWTDYQQGFGILALGGDFWLGLERIHELTTKHPHELYITLRNINGGERYARYGQFSIGSAAEQYKLNISDYQGNAGDAMSVHNGMKFSTYDIDNDLDERNCAKTFEGAWWFKSCHNSHLNGPYNLKTAPTANGIAWSYSNTLLTFAQMAIRRKEEY